MATTTIDTRKVKNPRYEAYKFSLQSLHDGTMQNPKIEELSGRYIVKDANSFFMVVFVLEN